jgi:hypothetical protein
MKRKLWLFSWVLLLLVVITIATLAWPTSDHYAVRVVGRTNDVTGQLHIFYELTNMTPRGVNLTLADIEAKIATGWHQASNNRRQQQRGKTRSLDANSTVVIHIVAPSEASAVRGEVQYAYRNLTDKFRWQLYRLGFPQKFRVGSVLGEEYGSLPLPEVQTAGTSFLLIPIREELPRAPEPGHILYFSH